jgi:hypothetical protein
MSVQSEKQYEKVGNVAFLGILIFSAELLSFLIALYVFVSYESRNLICIIIYFNIIYMVGRQLILRRRVAQTALFALVQPKLRDSQQKYYNRLTLT